eukprot:INCI13919.1.p1 GENE.INCI13919.1~~INCI13919.1.p1  ORF type:complete len:1628 (-),score=290.45 INCI13919.1:476-5359(-)
MAEPLLEEAALPRADEIDQPHVQALPEHEGAHAPLSQTLESTAHEQASAEDHGGAPLSQALDSATQDLPLPGHIEGAARAPPSQSLDSATLENDAAKILDSSDAVGVPPQVAVGCEDQPAESRPEAGIDTHTGDAEVEVASAQAPTPGLTPIPRARERSAPADDRDEEADALGRTPSSTPDVSSSRGRSTSVSFQAMSSFGLSTESFDVSSNIRNGDTRTINTTDLTTIMAEDPSLSFDKARLLLVDAQMRAAGIDPATGLPFEANAGAAGADSGRWVCRNCSFNNRPKAQKKRSRRKGVLIGRRERGGKHSAKQNGSDDDKCDNCGWLRNATSDTARAAGAAAAESISQGRGARHKHSSTPNVSSNPNRRDAPQTSVQASPASVKARGAGQSRGGSGKSSLSTLSPEDAAEVATFLLSNPLGFAYEHHTSILRSRNWATAPYLFARHNFFQYHRTIEGLDSHIEQLLAQRTPLQLGASQDSPSAAHRSHSKSIFQSNRGKPAGASSGGGSDDLLSERQKAGLIVELMKSLRSWAGERPKRRLKFHVAVDEWRNDQLLPVEASADAKKLERARKKRMQLQRQYKEARAEAESGGQRFPSTAAAKSKPSASPVSKPNNPRVVAAAAAAAAVGTQSATNMAAALDNSVRLLFLRHGEGDHNACKQVAGTWYQDASLTVLGIEQALVTGSILRHVKVDKVLVSPLTRALETCALMFHDRLKHGAIETLVCPEAREFRSTQFMRSHMGSSATVLRQRFGCKPTSFRFNATHGPVPLDCVFDRSLLAPEEARARRAAQLRAQTADATRPADGGINVKAGSPTTDRSLKKKSDSSSEDFGTVEQLSDEQMMVIAHHALSARAALGADAEADVTKATPANVNDDADADHVDIAAHDPNMAANPDGCESGRCLPDSASEQQTIPNARAPHQLASASIRHKVLVAGAGCAYNFLGCLNPRYIATVTNRFAPWATASTMGSPKHQAEVGATVKPKGDISSYRNVLRDVNFALDPASCAFTLRRMPFDWPAIEADEYPSVPVHPDPIGCAARKTKTEPTPRRLAGSVSGSGQDPDDDAVSHGWRLHATNHFPRALPEVWSPLETQWQFCLRADRLRRWIAASFAPGSTVAIVAHGTLFKAMFPGELAMKNCEFRSFLLNPFDGSFCTVPDVLKQLSKLKVSTMMSKASKAVAATRVPDTNGQGATESAQDAEALRVQQELAARKAEYSNFVEKEAVAQQLRTIYRQFNPTKVPDVPRLMHKYAGSETEMLAALKRKYRLNRNSSLVVAVAKGHTEMVRLLLESKADVSETNASGETILHIALLHNFQKIAALVDAAAAKDAHHAKYRRLVPVASLAAGNASNESATADDGSNESGHIGGDQRNRGPALTMTMNRQASPSKQALEVAEMLQQQLLFSRSHHCSFAANIGVELRSKLSFLPVSNITVFCRCVNGKPDTLRKQNDTLRYTSSVVATEGQIGRAAMGTDVGAQTSSKEVRSSLAATGRIGFRPQFERRTFYVDLSDGALIYCSTPKRVSLKFNWLTQYKSIKLSARSRAVHNFTPGTRKNLDVSEFYVVEDITRSDSRWWLLAAHDEQQKWLWVNVVNSVAMEYSRYRSRRKRAWPVRMLSMRRSVHVLEVH